MIFTVYIFSFIVPISYAILGYLFWKHTPVMKSGKSGWRTPQSTKSEEAWKFANEYGGKGLFILGITEIIITAIIHFLIKDMDNLMYFVGISVVIIILQSSSFTYLNQWVDQRLKQLE